MCPDSIGNATTRPAIPSRSIATTALVLLSFLFSDVCQLLLIFLGYFPFSSNIFSFSSMICQFASR